jgi:hypothetical protein
MSRFLKLYTFLAIFFLINVKIVYSQDIDSTFISESVTKDTLFTITDTLQTDSLKLAKETKRDTIISVHFLLYDLFNSFGTKKEIEFSDYKYSGNLFSQHPFAFLRDMGFAGLPSELNLYGKGFNEISFTGMHGLLNDRSTNSFDLHLQQSEFIDSIEFVPLPRGFLYGGWNLVSVRFIPKEIISRTPKSRIRYYEGSYGEAMIDGQAFLLPYKKLNVYIDVTNRISGERFKNTSFGIWTGSTGANYYYSDNLTIFSNYYYHRGDVSLNGGINYQNILNSTSDVNSVMYDEILAPVIAEHQYNRKTVHRFNSGFRGRFLPDNITELTVYNGYSLDEFRNNENGIAQRIFTDYREKFYGLTLHNKYANSLFTFSLIGNYESVKSSIEYDRTSTNYFDYTDYSVSGLVSFKIADSTIIPSIFGRVFNHNKVMSYGFGGDVRIKLFDKFSVYAGTSLMNGKAYNSHFLRGNYDAVNGEAGFKYKSPNLSLSVNFFMTVYSDKNLLLSVADDSSNTFMYSTGQLEKQFGISAALHKTFYNFRYELNISSVKSKMKGDYYSIIPLQLYTGIFYTDQLFDNNLYLNTGFSFTFTGKQLNHNYLLDRPEIMFVYNSGSIPMGYRLDFIMQGEIQESAIVYFTWENLLDKKYYLTPFYPMPRRGIRFGIAWKFLN